MTYSLIHPRFYKTLFLELISFIKHPSQTVKQTKTAKQKVLETIGFFIIKIAASLTIATLLSLFYEPENITDSNMTERFSPLLLLLVGGCILPAYEEITFRLSLKYKPIYLSLSIATLSYYVVTKAIYRTNLSLVDDTFVSRILIALGVGIVSYSVVNRKSITMRLQRIWHRNFSCIYYASCILFAWLHIFNFELNTTNILLLPIITLPQLFSATIAGYTRVSFGFQYPLIIHMLTNTLFISLTFLPLD